MQLAQNALRVYMALLLAVPLGAGGLCCCLTDGMGQEVMAEIRAAPASSCCAKDDPAPASREGCPEEDGCDCPAVSDATLAPRPAEETVSVSPVWLPAPEGSPVARLAPAPVPAVAPLAHSPPGIPLWLANSVFRS